MLCGWVAVVCWLLMLSLAVVCVVCVVVLWCVAVVGMVCCGGIVVWCDGCVAV